MATGYELRPDTGGSWATFTPTVTLVGGAGNTTPVYTTNSGRYRQVGLAGAGGIVFFHFLLTGDGGDEGAGTGQLNIALPVAISASATRKVVPVGRIVNGANAYVLFGDFAASASTVALAQKTTISTQPDSTGADQNNATRTIEGAGWYEI